MRVAAAAHRGEWRKEEKNINKMEDGFYFCKFENTTFVNVKMWKRPTRHQRDFFFREVKRIQRNKKFFFLLWFHPLLPQILLSCFFHIIESLIRRIDCEIMLCIKGRKEGKREWNINVQYWVVVFYSVVMQKRNFGETFCAMTRILNRIQQRKNRETVTWKSLSSHCHREFFIQK